MINAQWVARVFPDLGSVVALAEGGQKWVFAAEHPTEGPVVIKVIKPNQDFERIRRELLAVQQVKSPRVPRVAGAGIENTVSGDYLWLREERVAGRTVRDLLNIGPFGLEDVVRLATHILEALAAAEGVRIVHRDVKPDNIIRSDNGDFWLLDFGIARHLSLYSITATSALGGPGTIGYAPPEQFRNHKRDVDSRADLFALAVTLVECLTGRNPYREGARDAQEVLRRVQDSPLLIPRIPGDSNGRFADLIATMGQRRMDCRPPTAMEALAWAQEIQKA